MSIRRFASLGFVTLGCTVACLHASCTSNGASGADAGTGAPDSGSGDGASVDGASGEGGANVLTIGVSNSLTGGLSSIGAPLHKAWTVAQTYINANGGILGKNVNFVEMDDATDDNTQSTDGGIVTGVAEKLIALNPAAVIGPNGSAQVDTVWQLFQAAKIPEISGTATSVEFETLPNDAGASSRYFFRTVPADDQQGKALALLAQLGPVGAGGALPDGGPLPGADAGDDGGGGDGGVGASYCHKLALLYYSNAYGIPMSNVVKANFPFTPVADQQITEGEATFTTQIAAIQAANPDCLAMILYDTDGDAFLEALTAAYGGPLPFFIMGTDGVYDSAYLTSGLASASAPPSSTIVEGTYGTNPDSNPVDSVNGPNYQFFRNLYVTAFPLPAGQADIDAFASNEFDAAMLLALSIEKAGGTGDGTAIRDSLLAITNGAGKGHGPGDFTGAIEDIQNGQAITYNGASGPCRLDPNTGNTTAGYIIWQVQNGNFVTVKHIRSDQLQ